MEKAGSKVSLGKPFQLVVADVVREMDPHGVVREGQWVVGPDGRRDLDVIIEGSANGVIRKIQIECKDYSNDRRPIGIALIDALDSKHRDLGMDVSLMCSNAGFTDDAVRKARRVGIGLIGVLRKDDPRIRYRVFDEFYSRRVKLNENADFNISWTGPPPPDECHVNEIMCQDGPVSEWLLSRVPLYLAANPIVRGVHSLKFRFKEPTEARVRGTSVLMTDMTIRFQVSGSWIAQRVEIDATTGLYNWMRQTIRLGPGQCTVEYKGVKFGEGGTPVKCPPDFDPAKPPVLANGDVYMWVLDLGGYRQPVNPPQLDALIGEDDLVWARKDIPTGATYSWDEEFSRADASGASAVRS